MNADQWPARRCSGDCKQGRRECTTPDACELPEVDSMRHYIETRVLLGWMIVAVVACLLAVVL